MNVTRRFDAAFALHRAGRDAEAFAAYGAVLEHDPRHAPALHFSALLLHRAGRTDEAIDRIERSLAADAGVSDAWSNAGSLYTAAGRAGDAERALQHALRLEPDLVEAWVNLSSLRLAIDDPVAAEAAARRALDASGSESSSVQPCSAKDAARTSASGAASAARPSSPKARYNLALALAAQGRPQQALDALDALDAAGTVDSDDRAVPAFRVQLLIASGRTDAAHRVLDDALARRDDPLLRIERARLADGAGRSAAALDDYGAALRLDAGNETALSEALFLKKRLVSWHGLGQLQRLFRERVLEHAERQDASALTPFSMLSDPASRADQRAAATAWSRRYADHRPSAQGIRSGRLRLGYLSADFHAHATGVLTAGLFEQHDRARFEVFGYSTGPDDGSALRARLVAGFDRFVDARGWSDERVAAAIADDGIDILIDLKGHTEHAPTGVTARRPAPIAVSYLGYPGTMGASFVDYLIGDAVVTPLADAADYAETLVLLPHSYQVNDDRRAVASAPTDAPTRAALGLDERAVVFCCFNALHKLTPEVLDAWAAVLQRVPDGVLWLLTRGDDEAVRDRLRREAVGRGVAAGRLVFAATRPHAEYLALYRRADIFLDTWPYNAHTTASDALWAGCPLLTFSGETFAGRVASSLLTAAGFECGIAADRDAYVERAVTWGNDRPLLDALRARLEASVASSPLFDTRRTTRAVESACFAMAEQHRQGVRSAIVVPPSA